MNDKSDQLDALDRYRWATALKESQTQIDEDGTMIAVSRQALEETLALLSDIKSGKLQRVPDGPNASFELHSADGEYLAGTDGPREDAMREIRHYEAIFGQDGPVQLFEVIRTPVEAARAEGV